MLLVGLCSWKLTNVHLHNTNNFVKNPGGGVLGSGFAGYVPLASQNPHPIIVYSVANL